MIASIVKNWIDSGESTTLEFKTSFQKEVIETTVAFANTVGGNILIGVKDDGTVIGVAVVNETLQDYINQIKNATEPSLIVNLTSIEIESKTLWRYYS